MHYICVHLCPQMNPLKTDPEGRIGNSECRTEGAARLFLNSCYWEKILFCFLFHATNEITTKNTKLLIGPPPISQVSNQVQPHCRDFLVDV